MDSFVVPGTLQPDSSIVIDFPTTADLSAFGQYDLKAFVNHPMDNRVSNDTITQTTFHVFNRDMDVSLAAVQPTCASSAEANFTFRNIGAEIVTNATIEISVTNGADNNTVSVPYTGNLGFNQSQAVTWPIQLLGPGDNVVEISVTDVNGQPDDNPVDNTASQVYVWNGDLVEVTLNLLTDN